MRILKSIILILIISIGGFDNSAHSSVYPSVLDWDNPQSHSTSLKIYDVGTEIIKNGNTPVATLTTVQQHERGSVFNYSNTGQILVTHNSFLVNVTKGDVYLDFFFHDGSTVTLAAAAGNSYEFEPKSFTINSAVTNDSVVLVTFDGVQFLVPPGELTQIVAIDIMPPKKSSYPNQKTTGLIPVVIFGSTYLDVNHIEIGSLNFERLTVKTEGGTDYLAGIDHINDDEYLDLIVIFEADDTFMSNGFSDATLKGSLSNGTIINGKKNFFKAH